MGKLLDLIPSPYRWLAWLALAAVIAGFGVWGGVKATAAYYQPKLAAQTARADEFESAYGHLAQAVSHQNAAIKDLNEEGERRQREAAKAVIQAKARGQRYLDRLPVIAAIRPRTDTNTDVCRDAQRAVDDELKWERGTP